MNVKWTAKPTENEPTWQYMKWQLYKDILSELQPPGNSRKCWKSVHLEFPCSQCRRQDFWDPSFMISHCEADCQSQIVIIVCTSFLLYWDPTSTSSHWGPVTQFPTNIPSTTVSRCGSAD